MVVKKKIRSKVKRTKMKRDKMKRDKMKSIKIKRTTKRSLKRRSFKKTKKTKINRKKKKTKRMKRMKGGMEAQVGEAGGAAGGTVAETPPEGLCFKKESKSGFWKTKYVKIEGESLNVYESSKSGEPIGEERRSSIPDLTGVVVAVGEEPFGITRKKYPKLIISNCRALNGDTKNVELAFDGNFQGNLRGIQIMANLKAAIENISEGRQWNISLDEQYITTKKQELGTQVESKIAHIPEESDIFVQTFNRLKRISGASFVRLLRIHGVNIVLLGDPHGMVSFGKEESGQPRVSRVAEQYEPDRLCEDYTTAVNPSIEITKHETYSSFEAHKIGYGQSRRNYGIDPSMESCSMADLVQFCIDNSSSVEAFPEASSFGVLTRLDSSSSKYKTMSDQELSWLSIWNGLTPEQKGSAKDIVKVHATDQRAGSYKGLDSLLVILIGRNSISKTDLKVLTLEEYSELLDKFPMWKKNIKVSTHSGTELFTTRFMTLYNLHSAIIGSEDPWQTIRDIYLCLATFGILPEYLTHDITLSQNHLSDYIELISFEDLCSLLSLRGITPQEIQSIKESVTDEASLVRVRGEVIELIKSNKIPNKRNLISPQYIELYRQHYERARSDYGTHVDYIKSGLKINEFLVDYFYQRGFISEEEKPHVVAILHFAGLDFYLGTQAQTTDQDSTLARPTLMSESELVEYQLGNKLTKGQQEYYSHKSNPVGVDTYTNVNPFSIPGMVKIARTTKLAKQLLMIGRYKYGIEASVSLRYIFGYLSLIGTAEYPNHYWGDDFLYDVFTCLRLERLLLKHISLQEKLSQMGQPIDLKTAATLFDILEKEILTAKLGSQQVKMEDYVSRLSSEDLQSKITKALEKPKTILVIGGGSQTNVPKSGKFLVGDQYASGHPVETLKFLQVMFEDLNSGRGGGVIDNRSDCSVFEGFFE